MKSRKRRTKIVVDRKLQSALVGRALHYWLICICAVACFAISGWFLRLSGMLSVAGSTADMSSGLATLLISLMASLLLVPIVIFDLLRFSNRFIGPMQRLSRSMDRASKGEPVEPIKFREGDYWYEFAEKFNALLIRVHDIEEKLSERDRLQPTTSVAGLDS